MNTSDPQPHSLGGAVPIMVPAELESKQEKYDISFSFEQDLGEGGGWRFDTWKDIGLGPRRDEGDGPSPKFDKELVHEFVRKFKKEFDGTNTWKWWREEGIRLPTDRVDELVLDHIVRNQTIEPLEAVVTVVERHVTWELRGFGHGIPCWSYERLNGKGWKEIQAQLALIFPRLFVEATDFEEFLKFHRQLKKVRVVSFEEKCDGALGISLRISATLTRYDKGEVCHCIPIPGKKPKTKREGKEPQSVNSPEVVLASPLVEADLKRLSQVWQDRFAKSVLVTGPPGSGKESFATSLAYGSGRGKSSKDESGGIHAMSLGECSPDEAVRRLFGWRKDDGSVEGGLIARAKGSSLLIDEAHYPPKKPGARAALLRALEAGTYYPVGSDREQKVEDVLWVFASSRSLVGAESIANVPPKDFWTRMSHVVPVRHPLDAGALRSNPEWLREKQAEEDRRAAEQRGRKGRDQQAEESGRQEGADQEIEGRSRQPKPLANLPWEIRRCQSEALMHFFCFFWVSRLEEYFGREIVDIPPPEGPADQTPDQIVVDRKLRRLLAEKIPEGMSEAFADFLLEEVGSSSLHQISIRGLRGMVGQLLSNAIQMVEGSSEEDLVELVKRDLPDVYAQMQQVASLKATK